MKPPNVGKSRLRGAVDYHPQDEETHTELVLALAADTVGAATASSVVRRVLVVAADPAALSGLCMLGAEVVDQGAARDLNTALRHGERILRAADPTGVVAALQADLPALRAEELSAALSAAAGRRAFVADRQGTGTTLLVSAPGAPLNPLFGPGSALAHTASGAVPLDVDAPSLRSDVDTAADLAHARRIGLGEHTATLLGESCCLG
ncbi:2-phospho-L-lactate guanylyltransferase [Amycolatopsis suaedae]|uniref:2-phospho-L-lactate guanylyltransferase n=1 Tax=Amycolatopsis suaedae TaxID=2510978 RepID=A0A4Q7JCA5_9PSEU|nr:2-phospho-L-lactate guanylyltransferase [Amycolatopsis suaedae]RZQ64917.1 2-phospho-L-lactate guanylyltransferase [Amycolatopsis suaedae]